MTFDDFIQIQLGWFNAWIPSFALILLQILSMFLYKEGAKRAVDTSWYSSEDRVYGALSFLFQGGILVMSLFVPFRPNSVFFIIGALFFTLAIVGYLAAFHVYATTPKCVIVHKGIYKLSRNPMYFFYEVGTLAICIASSSLWLLLATIPLIFVTHKVILGEERYCLKAYGEDYANYKAKTPRYFLFI